MKAKIGLKKLVALAIFVSYIALIVSTVSAQASTPITFGKTISANISSYAQRDTYTFSANSGDSIYIMMGSSWYNGPELRLYAPNGTLIYYASGFCGQICTSYSSTITTQPLNDGGVYTILAGDYSGRSTGNYGLYAQRTNNPGPTPTPTPTPDNVITCYKSKCASTSPITTQQLLMIADIWSKS